MARRKKKEVKKEENVIEELDGFKVDDSVWAEYFGGRIIQGRIIRFITTEAAGNVVCLTTQNEGYRTVLLSNCSHSVIKKKRPNKK